MHKFLLLGLLALSACDFLPAEDRSVVLNGTVLDAATDQPVAGIAWVVETTRGFGSTDLLDEGRTASDGTFQARYEFPWGSDPTLVIVPDLKKYKASSQQVYGMGKTITVTVRLGRRE